MRRRGGEGVGGRKLRSNPFLRARPWGERPLRIAALLTLTIAALSIPAAVLSSTFVMYNASLVSRPVPPPVTLSSTSNPNEVAVVGPNETSASVTLKATAGWKEITRNGGFLQGPDGWLLYPGTYLTGGYWFPYALGAYGVIKLNGSISGSYTLVSDSEFIGQSVVIPNTSINDIEVNVTYYFNTTSSGAYATTYLYAYLLDTSGNTVWSDYVTPVSGAWDNVTFTVPTTDVTPGDTYTLLVGVEVYVLLIPPLLASTAYYNVSLYFDAVRMYVNVTYPTFAGYVLLTNVSVGSYLAGLKAVGLTASGLVNASVSLMNLSGVSTTSISVVNSELQTSSTSTVNITVPPPGYTSGRVWVSATLTSGSSATLKLMLVYSVGGVTVEYPITLNITDPPAAGGGGAGPPAPHALPASVTALVRCPSCLRLGSRR